MNIKDHEILIIQLTPFVHWNSLSSVQLSGKGSAQLSNIIWPMAALASKSTSSRVLSTSCTENCDCYKSKYHNLRAFLNYLNILWLPTNRGHPLTEVCGVLRIGVQKVNGDINVVLSQANQHHQACSTKQKVTTNTQRSFPFILDRSHRQLY